MKRRKGKARKPIGRSQPIWSMIERLETRQLLAGFVSIAVPGAIETGTVDFIESAAHINVEVVEPVCSFELKAGADSHCQSTNEFTSTGNLASTRSLSVGDGFGFRYVAPDFTGNDSVTNESTLAEVSIGPFLQPAGFDPITVITEEPVVEIGPINQQSQPVPEVGVYFSESQTLLGDQPGDTTTTATVTNTNEARIVPLARTQQFALLSPADILGPNIPLVDGPATATPLPNSLSPTDSQVDAVFEDLDDDLLSIEGESFKPTLDVTELDLGTPEAASSKPTKLSDPLSDPTLDHLSTATVGVFSNVPLRILEDVLQSMDFEESLPEEPVFEEAPVNPDLPVDDADDNKLVEGIYLVEGVILLAALPRSIDRSHDEETLE